MQSAVAADRPRASAPAVSGFDRRLLAAAAALAAGALGTPWLALATDPAHALAALVLVLAGAVAMVVGGWTKARRQAIAALDKSEQEARQSRQRLADVLEAVAEGVALYDRNDRLVMCNSSFRRINAGIAYRIVVGAALRDLTDGAAEGAADAGEAGGAAVRRTSRRTQDGASVFVFADVTELREARQALERSENRGRKLLEAARDAAVIHDGERILYANPAAASLFGAGCASDLVGRDPALLIHPEDRREAIRREADRASGVAATETRRRFRLDGGVLETETTTLPIEWNGRACTLETSRDATELARARAEAARLRDLLHRRPDPAPRDPPPAKTDESPAPSASIVDISRTPAADLPPAARDAFIRKLAQVYLDHGTKDMERLAAAVRGGDATAVAIRAHGLKSSSANVGAQRLAELCGELEAAARAGTDAGFGELFARIAREFDAVRDHLTAQIGGPAAANG
jgi:PAS domain S-box-containing protein